MAVMVTVRGWGVRGGAAVEVPASIVAAVLAGSPLKYRVSTAQPRSSQPAAPPARAHTTPHTDAGGTVDHGTTRARRASITPPAQPEH